MWAEIILNTRNQWTYSQVLCIKVRKIKYCYFSTVCWVVFKYQSLQLASLQLKSFLKSNLLLFTLILHLSSFCSDAHGSLTLKAVWIIPRLFANRRIQYVISSRHDHEIKTHMMRLNRRTEMRIVKNLHKSQEKWSEMRHWSSCGEKQGCLLWIQTRINNDSCLINFSLIFSQKSLLV